MTQECLSCVASPNFCERVGAKAHSKTISCHPDVRSSYFLWIEGISKHKWLAQLRGESRMIYVWQMVPSGPLIVEWWLLTLRHSWNGLYLLGSIKRWDFLPSSWFAYNMHRILAECLFSNKIVLFPFYLCGEIFWFGRDFVFNNIHFPNSTYPDVPLTG